MTSLRIEKLGGLIQAEVSSIIKKHINDPRIGFISITQVKVTPDLKQARVYVSCLGTEEEQIVSMQGLESAASFIRGKLAHNLAFKSVPEIAFVQDRSLERGSRVIALINDLNKENKHAQKNSAKNQKRA